MGKKKSKLRIGDPNIYNVTEQSEALIIHVDTLKLKLKEYEESIWFRNLALSFIGIILTILLVFVTTSFKDAFGLSAYVWQAFFMLILLTILVALICSLILWLRKRTNVDIIIEDFKKRTDEN